jgi:hypothetical protein
MTRRPKWPPLLNCAVIQPDTCHVAGMVETSYRVVARAKHRFDVEMANPNGRRKMIEGFGSEHEANAWIIQTQRMLRAAGPWTPLAPRKPHAASSISVPPAPSLPQSEQHRVQDAPNRPQTRRIHGRAAREPTTAKP